MMIKKLRKWTYNDAREAALWCKNRHEFKNNYSQAYKLLLAKDRAYLDQVFGIVSREDWKALDRDMIFDLVRRCSTREELKQKYNMVYKIMLTKYKNYFDKLLPSTTRNISE